MSVFYHALVVIGVAARVQISQGLLIDESTENKCKELYDQGMALMNVGLRARGLAGKGALRYGRPQAPTVR
jgi:hypothetical protein